MEILTHDKLTIVVKCTPESVKGACRSNKIGRGRGEADCDAGRHVDFGGK